MDNSPHDLFRVFDPNDDVSITERRLPHWEQAGTLSFITWRTWDSIPAAVLAQCLRDRSAWLAAHGIDSSSSDWRLLLQKLPPSQRNEFHCQFSDRWHRFLDDCHGEYVLRRPDLAKVVADSFHHFDGNRYYLSDFVVMPNHVHVLVAFPTEQKMLDQCDNWKHFTAVRLNKLLGRSGRFWQVDGFDRLVRSESQFLYLRKYIADNPVKATLRAGEFIHYSREL